MSGGSVGRATRVLAIFAIVLVLLLVPAPGSPTGTALGAAGVPGCTGGSGPIDYSRMEGQGLSDSTVSATSSTPSSGVPGSPQNTSSCGWKVATIPTYIAQHEYALWSAAWAGSSDVVAVGDLATILLSTNGGVSWVPVSDPSPDADLHVVTRDDNGVLWAAGTGGTVLQSINGGVSWTNYAASGLGGNITTLTFLEGGDSWFGYAGTSDGVYVTRDAGSSWSQVTTPVGNLLRSVAFFDPEHGWVEGDIPSGGEGVFYTSNGGATWTEGQTGGQITTSRTIVATGPTQAWMLGSRSLIFQTTDALNWSYKTFNIDLEVGGAPVGPALDVVDGQYGWATEQEGNMFYTSDGGACWMEQGVPTIPEMYGFDFENPSDGVAVGTGVIWYTTDGGTSPGDLPGTIGGTSCLPALPYAPEVLGTAVGVGVGAALLSTLMVRRRERKAKVPPPTPVESRAASLQASRKRHRKSHRYVGGG